MPDFMSTARAIFRVAAISISTLLHYLVLLGGTAVLAFSRDRRARWRMVMVRSWAKSAACILGVRVTVQGTPPRPPFFIVSNHLSYLDIVVYFTQLKGAFIAKKEVRSWPVLGFLAHTANTLFIDRRNHRDLGRINRLIAGHINARQGVILFAEGTSTAGATVNPFKPSLLEYPAGNNLPVSYASISYRTPAGAPPAHLAVCWWGDMTFGGHAFNLFRIPRVEASIVFGDQTVQERDRKRLANELWKKVHQQFIPVVSMEELWPTNEF